MRKQNLELLHVVERSLKNVEKKATKKTINVFKSLSSKGK